MALISRPTFTLGASAGIWLPITDMWEHYTELVNAGFDLEAIIVRLIAVSFTGMILGGAFGSWIYMMSKRPKKP